MEEKALTIIVSCGVRWREERSVEASSSMALSRTVEVDFGERRLLRRDDETVVLCGAGDQAETTLLLPL